ncbi:hypothetical protein ACLKA7_012954 [Drosophila subpalustris]
MRMVFLSKEQVLKCLLCRRSDYKPQTNFKDGFLNSTPERSNDRNSVWPLMMGKDYIYNKNSWRSKMKRNFDEIDKASVSFGILNPLV